MANLINTKEREAVYEALQDRINEIEENNLVEEGDLTKSEFNALKNGADKLEDFLEDIAETDAKLKLVKAISLIAEASISLSAEQNAELREIRKQLSDFEDSI